MLESFELSNNDIPLSEDEKASYSKSINDYLSKHEIEDEDNLILKPLVKIRDTVIRNLDSGNINDSGILQLYKNIDGVSGILGGSTYAFCYDTGDTSLTNQNLFHAHQEIVEMVWENFSAFCQTSEDAQNDEFLGYLDTLKKTDLSRFEYNKLQHDIAVNLAKTYVEQAEELGKPLIGDLYNNIILQSIHTISMMASFQDENPPES